MQTTNQNTNSAGSQEAAFTPGPWDIEKHEGQGKCFINGAAGLSVAYVYGDSNKELEANARLIAAAPEMYEIIKNLARPGINHGEARQLVNRIEGRKVYND